jgi:integral membrane protein
MNVKTPFGIFRIIALLEGISYLLFAITMPFKYAYGIAGPNYIIGMLHGLLFMAYCFLGLYLAIRFKWKFGFAVLVFVASFIPFGTFFMEARYFKKMAAAA